MDPIPIGGRQTTPHDRTGAVRADFPHRPQAGTHPFPGPVVINGETTMRFNAVAGAVTLSLAATVLAACGSSNSSGGASASGDYCSELKADKAYFQGLSGNGSDAGKL